MVDALLNGTGCGVLGGARRFGAHRGRRGAGPSWRSPAYSSLDEKSDAKILNRELMRHHVCLTDMVTHDALFLHWALRRGWVPCTTMLSS